MRFELTCYMLRVLPLSHYTTGDRIDKLLLISDIQFQITQGKFDEFISPDQGLFERNM